MPPGLNPDEASNGVDAASIYRYGTDRNGVSFPIKFVSWGSGQDALYGYLLVPLIALLGLSPGVERLPMLIAGILSLPVFYLVAKDTFGPRLALLSVFFLAISPWHILVSRWGLESNLFPFVFLGGYVCLLQVRRRASWFVVAAILFGISLYSYGTAYAVVPVFMLFVLTILTKRKILGPRQLILGTAAFTALAVPVALLVIVNGMHLPSLMLGPITIPRFPVEARFTGATVLGSSDVANAIANSLWSGLRLLVIQTDGILNNVVDPYGYFYSWTFPVAVLGAGLLIQGAVKDGRLEFTLLLAWKASAAVIAIFQVVNINRFNIIFMPLLLCTAFAIDWLAIRWKPIMPLAIIGLLVAFAAFSATYHGSALRNQANRKFDAGLLGAIQFARTVASNPICITDRINMPYIFALFSEQTSPAAYLSSVKYLEPEEPLRQVVSFGRYVFGTKNCATGPTYTYVVTTDEIPPRLGNRYQYEFFDNFVVYYPK